ncbi:MAG TPA: hypothetical protein VJ890_04915 [Vineibacter sp.]|nr:hypothetical protein [Vineibacter sp.]
MPIWIKFLTTLGPTAAGSPIKEIMVDSYRYGGDKLKSTGPRWPPVSELTVTLVRDSSAPALDPRLGSNTPIAAELNFTRLHGGREISELRALLHNVRILHRQSIVRPGGGTSAEKIVMTYTRMTRAGAPESAPDISLQAKARAEQATRVSTWDHSYDFRAGKWTTH